MNKTIVCGKPILHHRYTADLASLTSCLPHAIKGKDMISDVSLLTAFTIFDCSSTRKTVQCYWNECDSDKEVALLSAKKNKEIDDEWEIVDKWKK